VQSEEYFSVACVTHFIPFFFFKRYFETDHALNTHWKSKVHKRRCKALKEPAYTIEEAERAAGLGREDKNPLTLRVVKEVDMG
jgi:bud site selection protein 20